MHCGRLETPPPAPYTPSRSALAMSHSGDTPRIFTQAMGSSGAWAHPLRGSVPVAWTVNLRLAEMFPALIDFYASTATVNDSFVAAIGGGGYVFPNQLSPTQLARYARTVGRLLQRYRVPLVDTYGMASLSDLANFSLAAAAGGGVAPQGYTSQPLWTNRHSWPLDPFKCNGTARLPDARGTLLLCTSSNLFYEWLDRACPSCDLAARIEAVAERCPPPPPPALSEPTSEPCIVLVYGGLKYWDGFMPPDSPLQYFPLLRATMERLGETYEAITSAELARLGRRATATV